MGRWACVALMLVGAAWSGAQPTLVPPEILAQIEDTDPNPPLPRFMTPREKLLPLPAPPRGPLAPPSGVVDTPAEYELCDGLLIRWGTFNSILTQLVVGVTTLDPTARMWIIVASTSEQASATSTLQSAGADLSQVVFIIAPTNTVWIRDYGPRFIFEENGSRAIVDHIYNRPRPLDDAIPGVIGQRWGEAVYALPLYHGGGNFHLFDNADAFLTDLIVTENPTLTPDQIIGLFRDYQNVNTLITAGFPTSIDATRHIDMWFTPVGARKVIIGQYAGAETYPARQITNNMAAYMQSQGYTVYRTPGWNSGSGGYNGTHYTYTNSVIINNLCFIPWYSRAEDAQALTAYQQAMPNHTMRQIDCRTIIGSAGALHCIVMHVPQSRAALGDLNCDGAVNAFDIGPFVLALTNPSGYAAAYPNCNRHRADVNLDGDVNVFDIDAFVARLGGG